MEDIEYTYTRGMDQQELENRLAEEPTGILALADGDDAYAIPLVHYFDGARLYFRMGMTDDSTKRRYWDATEKACYVVYGAEHTDDPRTLDSWSIIATGRLTELDASQAEEFPTAAINRRFAPIRFFDEPIDEVDIVMAALEIETITGRRTTEP